MIDRGELRVRALRATGVFAIVLAGLVLLPAWSPRYWQGWLLWAHFMAWCLALTLYFLARDPALIERRMQSGSGAETRAAQKRIQFVNAVLIILLFAGSALDGGQHWSSVPVAILILGHVLVALSFLWIGAVFRENSFAAATVQLAEGQRVISTGPYAWVRHPMYFGAVLLFLGIPLALGSYWGLVAVPLLVAGLVVRLKDEESLLLAELDGYSDYCRRVRWRLVPGLW